MNDTLQSCWMLPPALLYIIVSPFYFLFLHLPFVVLFFISSPQNILSHLLLLLLEKKKQN